MNDHIPESQNRVQEKTTNGMRSSNRDLHQKTINTIDDDGCFLILPSIPGIPIPHLCKHPQPHICTTVRTQTIRVTT
jgi:hypothetical protein